MPRRSKTSSCGPAISCTSTTAGGGASHPRRRQTSFDAYPLLRFPDAPPVETYIVPSTSAPCGAGEMGIPGAAPALANAICVATGRRLRDLPLGRFSLG
jgi:isoquinoline 1-oxidoreductase beta subunit